jgi:hypothetical protein
MRGTEKPQMSASRTTTVNPRLAGVHARPFHDPRLLISVELVPVELYLVDARQRAHPRVDIAFDGRTQWAASGSESDRDVGNGMVVAVGAADHSEVDDVVVELRIHHPA